MLAIILLLVIGTCLVYISKFNFAPVSVNLGFYAFSDIPLFYVIVGSLLTGLVLSYVFYLINSIFTSFTLYGKENEIKKNKNEVLSLTKRIHSLESENEKLNKALQAKSKNLNL